MRLPKSDHDRWAREHDLGALSWETARPFYQSLERTSGTGGTGGDGPFPIHQLGDEEVSDQHRAFIASALAAGHKRTAATGQPSRAATRRRTAGALRPRTRSDGLYGHPMSSLRRAMALAYGRLRRSLDCRAGSIARTAPRLSIC